MAFVYSTQDREEDEYGLPNVEVFYCQKGEYLIDDEHVAKAGWYWWACFPGCLPDGDPVGPFKTEAEATADALEDE